MDSPLSHPAKLADPALSPAWTKELQRLARSTQGAGDTEVQGVVFAVASVRGALRAK